MKNVCFFNSTMFWGGGEKAHLEYAEYFMEFGYNVWLVCSTDSILHKKSKEKGIKHFNTKIGKLSFLNPLKKKILIRFFKKNSIDTVFLNASSDLKIGGLSAKKALVKNIVYMRGLAVPIKNSLLNRYLLTKVVTHVVPNSLDTKKALLTKLQPLLNDGNVYMIYRGINFKQWDNRPRKVISFKENDEIILGNVGRLVPQKGQKYLVSIAKILLKKGLNFKIIITGSGPLKNELETMINENKLGKYVKLIGFQSDVKSFLNGIDIFVFPSLWEGFGNAMVEAMAEQKVPVAYDLTSNPEIIQNGVNGFLVKYPDIDGFADKILYLAQNPKKRILMGEAARKSVIDKFSLKKIIKEWEELLS